MTSIESAINAALASIAHLDGLRSPFSRELRDHANRIIALLAAHQRQDRPMPPATIIFTGETATATAIMIAARALSLAADTLRTALPPTTTEADRLTECIRAVLHAHDLIMHT